MTETRDSSNVCTDNEAEPVVVAIVNFHLRGADDAMLESVQIAEMCSLQRACERRGETARDEVPATTLTKVERKKKGRRGEGKKKRKGRKRRKKKSVRLDASSYPKVPKRTKLKIGATEST